MTRETCIGDHRPPLGAGIPRSFKPIAIDSSVRGPHRRSSSMIGSSCLARLRAFSALATAARIRSPVLGALPRKPPSLTPRAFAAASAARVRSLILRPSSSAIAASMCSRKVSAWGMSTAVNRTSDFINAEITATSLAKRSSFAMSKVAPTWRHLSKAAASWGLSGFRPDSTSTKLSKMRLSSLTKLRTASCCAASPRPD